MVSLDSIKSRYDRLALLKEQVDSSLSSTAEVLKSADVELSEYTQAHEVLLKVASSYRKSSVGKIEALVTRSLQAVFEHPYEFQITLNEKRGQIETEFTVKDGKVQLELEFQS